MTARADDCLATKASNRETTMGATNCCELHEPELARAKALPLGARSEKAATARECSSGQLLSRALSEANCSQEAFGAAAGVSRQKVSAWVAGTAAPSLVHIIRAATVRRSVVANLADQLKAITESQAHLAKAPESRSLDATKEFGEAIGAVRDACEDGKIDAREAKTVLREIHEAIEALEKLAKDVEVMAGR